MSNEFEVQVQYFRKHHSIIAHQIISTGLLMHQLRTNEVARRISSGHSGDSLPFYKDAGAYSANDKKDSVDAAQVPDVMTDD